MPLVHFLPLNRCVEVDAGTSLLDAAARAGVVVEAPCGGEGTCGQCRVRIETGSVDSVQRGCLTSEEIANGTVLACSSRVQENVTVRVADQAHGRDARIVTDAAGHPLASSDSRPYPPAIKRFLAITPPAVDDGISDFERLERALRKSDDIKSVAVGLPVLRSLAWALRERDYQVTATLVPCAFGGAEIIRVEPGDTTGHQLGLAIDVGTTTCAVRLVNLVSGEILGVAADYNGQLTRGADVISRISYARRPERADELQRLVVDTLNGLIGRVCNDHGVNHTSIDSVVIVGNTTMIHLLLGLPPEHIRLAPYTPTINRFAVLKARELNLLVYSEAAVVIAPSVGSYVGGDITAGLLPTALAGDNDEVQLFIDFGTNGEVVVGNGEWLMACAASAGPAFEGAGVSCGMRAMAGAIESVRIDPATLETSVSVIGGGKPTGICGSGLVDLLSEMLTSGLIDPSGKIDPIRGGSRVQQAGESGRNLAFTIVPAEATSTGKPIAITEHDLANLIRTKAAVYSACTVMLKSVGLDFDAVATVYVAGGFGRYLNLQRSISIGLLPDLPAERFTYLGNSALIGAHAMLCDAAARAKVNELADRMTYVELNTDPAYMGEYTAALFLPHTDLDRFPSMRGGGNSKRTR